ncbi:MAG: hypothetical protein JSV44_11830 [Candidatus Zixiibacteriota bacterium]|nr:MAG: hypothetical protein JSV44_11830 [candidate division Zixibacteria bacterium]
MLKAHVKSRKSLGLAAVLTLAIIIMSATGLAQNQQFEEIVLKLQVSKLADGDIMAQYDGRDIFLPLIEIFNFLEINIVPDIEKGVFAGQYVTSDNKFRIDLPEGKAKCFGKTVFLPDSAFHLTPTDLFLRIDMFESIFRLKMHFNFSTLSVYMPLNKEFPAYQKLLRKAAHENLLDEEVASRDILEIPYRRDNLKAGVADWMLSASPYGGGGHYFNAGLGGMLIGGDLSLTGSANSITGFEADQIRYRWHYYFIDNEYLTQAELGDVNTGGSLTRSMEGVMLTNRPQVQRKYFQTVKISGHAGEGWEVELYVNNRLTDFAYADENGDYTFLVDTHYGSSRINIKMYAPNGEVRTNEEFIRVPYNLIPGNKLEYTIVAGASTVHRVQRKYAQAMGYYGIFNGLTVGACSEFPIDVDDGEKPTYAGEVTFQPFGTVLLGGTYSPDNLAEGSINYNRPSILTVNLKYTKYYENLFRNRLGKLNEITLSISSPLKLKRRYFGPRFRLSAGEYPDYRSINMNYGFKLPLYRLNATYMGACRISKYLNRSDSKISSQLFVSTQFLRWLRPQFKINYEHDINRVATYAVYLHKRVFKKGQLTFSFERNTISGVNRVMLSFNIFNGFANFTSRVNFSGDQTVVTQMQRGSVRFDQLAGNFRFDRRNGLGRGSAVIWPFLDENYNGRMDNGEELLKELKANIGGARGIRSRRNGLYYYDGLRPYDDYIIRVDEFSLDNPMLRPAHENFRITINPNTITSINVPIVTAGEVSGKVERLIPEGKTGVGGIKLKVENESTGKVTSITTFNDGGYFYLGLVPGMYRAYLDTEQLKRYGYRSEPSEISFQVKTVEGGDSIEAINFTIIPE